jgi:myo-inositol-1-phosphate synthase
MVGIAGATASTTISSILDQAHTGRPMRCTTASGPLRNHAWLPADEFAFCGWDFFPEDMSVVVDRQGLYELESPRTRESLTKIIPLKGVRTALDPPNESGTYWRDGTADPSAAVTTIANELRQAIHDNGADHACVFYAGSPYAVKSLKPFDAVGIKGRDDIDVAQGEVPASLLYGLGAIDAGADFVDFTPGNVLETPLLQIQAAQNGCQLAGSDGSTGQTMLKHALAELFESRGMAIRGWYGTNLIGNHDGYVLSLPEHRVIKIRDKSEGLSAITSSSDFDQAVAIEYIPHWGDRKESWDAIELEGWAGSPVSLRLNWRGADSHLAAAMIFDLARLLRLGRERGRAGLRSDLGYFFKRPIGREGATPGTLYRELIRALEKTQ